MLPQKYGQAGLLSILLSLLPSPLCLSAAPASLPMPPHGYHVTRCARTAVFRAEQLETERHQRKRRRGRGRRWKRGGKKNVNVSLQGQYYTFL